MKTRINKIIILIVLLGSATLWSMTNANDHSTSKILIDDSTTDPIKQRAFNVLQQKCNVCHKKQNPFKVFNLRNMDRLAGQVEEQVFILNRMPKGNDYNLNDQERESLTNWINSTKK